MRDKILSRLVKFEIRIRKAVNGHMHGNYKSIFKGSGLEFSDLRTYNFGDDLRLIDWNTSAKGHGIYIKLFKEEKEQQVFFMVDVSGSQKVGVTGNSKIDIAKEICGTLAISAMREASQVGLYCFSDQKELYLKPQNSMKHGYQLITKLFSLEPASSKTNLQAAILFTLEIVKKKSVIFLISDFIDVDYEHNLRALARKHDLIVIHLYDSRETALPRLGIIPVYELETQKIVWTNTSSNLFRSQIKNTFETNRVILEQICKENKANYLPIESGEDFAGKLIKLFKIRKVS
ncbi:MAG: DUF58 domain-containing protein [Bacteroidota bacterium]